MVDGGDDDDVVVVDDGGVDDVVDADVDAYRCHQHDASVPGPDSYPVPCPSRKQ